MVEQVIPKAVEQRNMLGYSDCRTLNSDQVIASLYGCVQKLMLTVEQLYNEIDTFKCESNNSSEKTNNISIEGVVQAKMALRRHRR